MEVEYDEGDLDLKYFGESAAGQKVEYDEGDIDTEFLDSMDTSLPTRMTKALSKYKDEVGEESFNKMNDQERQSSLKEFYDKEVKPTKEELKDRNSYLEGLTSFADDVLYTLTGNKKWRDIGEQRGYLQQAEEELPTGEQQLEYSDHQQIGFEDSGLTPTGKTKITDITESDLSYMAGRITPYVTGGIGAGMIKNLTSALVTDSGIQATLSFLEHARSDEALENIARDVAIDTVVNGVTFGIVRMLAKTNITKGEINKASNQLFGKNADVLEPKEAAKFQEIAEKSKAKIIDEAGQEGAFKDNDFMKALDDMLDPEVKLDNEIEVHLDKHNFSSADNLEMKERIKAELSKKAEGDKLPISQKTEAVEEVIPQVNKKSEAAKQRVATKKEQLEKEFAGDEAEIAKRMQIQQKKKVLPTEEQKYKGAPKSEIKAIDEQAEQVTKDNINTIQATKTDKEKQEIFLNMDTTTQIKVLKGLDEATASKVIPFASPESVGALYGFEQDDQGNWTYNITKGLMGAAGAKIAHKALTSNQMKTFIKKTLDDIEETAMKAAGGGTPPKSKPFYSQLEETIKQKMPNKAPVKMVRGLLKDIKKDEMKWSGVDAFLEGKDTVTKSELLDAISQPKMGGKTLKQFADTPYEMDRLLKVEEIENIYEGIEDIKDLRALLIEEENWVKKGMIKEFGKDSVKDGKWIDDVVDSFKKDSEFRGDETKFQDYTTKNIGNNYREELIMIDGSRVEEGYKSAHWDEPNVLYHTRKQDTKIGGKKTLLVEEIQSDWHQEGRKSGYVNAESIVEQKKLDATADADFFPHQKTSKVPQAPYSKTWHEKAMKDIIAEAVEKDYDRVAWVAGKEQADRYSLSKQIDSLMVQKNTDGTHKVSAQVGGRGQMLGEKLTDAQLEDNVGKEMAQKIIKGEGREINIGGSTVSQSEDLWKEFKGVDLEVGGEGMKTFYDSMLPKWTNKYIKKYGSKVEVKKLENGQEVWSFEVTPKMKEKISTEGQTLYANPTVSGGVVGGVVGGTETDEEGRITFNPKKALIGALAGSAVGFGAGKLYKNVGTVPDVPKGQLPNETKLQKVQRKIQDKFNRVAQLVEVKADSKTIDDSMNPYLAEELYHGRAEARMNKFKKTVLEPFTKKISNSKHSLDDLDSYLWAKHAPERNKKMLELNGIENGSGMSDQEAKKILEKLDTPEMEELAKYVEIMNKSRLKLVMAEGLETKETVDLIAGQYEHYVPLMRDMSDQFGSVVPSTGKGYDIKGKEFKRAKGSHRAVESPTMHSIIKYQEELVRSEKNRVGKAFLNFTEEFPDAQLYEVQSLKYNPRYDKNGNIVQMDPSYKLKDNVMHVKVDGKIKEITIHDEALASAMKNLTPQELKNGLQYAHKAVRFLAGMSTSYNPEFIFSNFTRDIQTALMNIPKEARPNRAKMVADVMPSIKGIHTGKGEWGKLYEEFASEGGKTGWVDSTDIGDLSKTLFRDIDKLEGKQPIRKQFDNFLDFVDKTNNAVENGVRLVVYKQAKEAGLTNKKAASIAKNLTVNFNRKGELGTVLNTAYMFANASIQGTKRMAEALSTSRKAQAGAVALAGTGLGLHLYNTSVDEENYKMIPQYIKDTNYVVMKDDGSGEYYKLPLPYGYNMLKTLGDVAGEAITGDMPHNIVTRTLSAAIDAFSPIGVGSDPFHTVTPTLGKLPYELVTNQNFFGGEIRPDAKAYGADDVPDSHKSLRSVNPYIKKGAEKLNELTGGTAKTEGTISISPETIEHIGEFVLGGFGKLVSNTAASTFQMIEGEEVDANKKPFKRRVKGKVGERAALYKARDILDRSGKNIISDRDRKEFDFYLDKAKSNKAIDEKYYLELKRSMGKNQLNAKFYKDKNIQDELTKEQRVELAKRLYFFYKDKKYKYGKGTITKARRDIFKQQKDKK